MRSNAKSSVTLPQKELELVQALKASLNLKSNVDVIRRGLHLLRDTTERRALQDAYRVASHATRRSTSKELEELDHLAGEGLD